VWRPQRGGGLGGATSGGRPGWLLDDEPEESASGTLHGHVLPGPSSRSEHYDDGYRPESADHYQSDYSSSSYASSGYPDSGYGAGYQDHSGSASSSGPGEAGGYGSSGYASGGYSGGGSSGDYAPSGYQAQAAEHQPSHAEPAYHSTTYGSGGYRATDDGAAGYRAADQSSVDYGVASAGPVGYGGASPGASDHPSGYAGHVPDQAHPASYASPAAGYGSEYAAADHHQPSGGPLGYGGDEPGGYASPGHGAPYHDEPYGSGASGSGGWYPEQSGAAAGSPGASWEQTAVWSPDGGRHGVGSAPDPQATSAFPAPLPAEETAAMSAVGGEAGDPFDYLYRSGRAAAETMASPGPPGGARTPTATRMLAPPADAPPRARRPGPAGADGASADQSALDSGGRAARRRAAAKPKGTTSSRIALALGELLMTTGALALLFVIYQLWWTNVLADRAMNNKGTTLEQAWQKNPTLSPLPNDAFAFMYIPRLGSDYRKVVMQGVDKNKVLDKGAIGHYSETAMPGGVGNFSVAAHRNTHGEPFRYLNTLQVGDKVVVETGTKWYTYQLDKELPQTSPNNVGVISKVPKGGPYTTTGDYITLTTCTPDFTSWYRLIWWGHLVSTQPRDANGPLPAALAGYTGPR
jgi:sortase A